ncbi:MAG TPA: right-handed parallel beta-helix repeat-containing protein [Sphingobium sp.]
MACSCVFALFVTGAVAGAPAAMAETYYLDSARGVDSNDGQSAGLAWRSLARLRDAPLKGGDTVLLVAGSTWREPLILTRSGRKGAPITVGRTGTGARPRIDVGGIAQQGVGILNAEYVSVSGLEVTNDGPPAGVRFGVLVAAENFGVTRGIAIRDMYVHDVRGTNDRKDNGGIVFRAMGERLPTRFEGISIERNIIWRVDRSGIAGISDQVTTARWFPSRQVVIRDNYLEDIGGDGIVPRATDAALIEHNIVRYAASRAPGYNVAIWQWSTDNTVIQLNEAAFTRGRFDGQGFDSDYNSRRTTIAYNYSHDNAGGFVLICAPGRRATDNLGNRGTVVRSNVSRNDGARIFQLSGGISDVRIERNVIWVPKGQDVQMVAATEWQGWASDVRFRDNVFAVAGTARYGRETGRNGPDYVIAAGFPPAEHIGFDGNRFLGRHVDPPEDKDGEWKPDYKEPVRDWAIPTFDPAKPDGFGDYLGRHREWMLGMLARELEKPVALMRPNPTSSIDTRR